MLFGRKSQISMTSSKSSLDRKTYSSELISMPRQRLIQISVLFCPSANTQRTGNVSRSNNSSLKMRYCCVQEANNSMRLQNVDLSCKLRRMEALFARVNDELAQYRTAEGKSPFQNFDEESRLQEKLQVSTAGQVQRHLLIHYFYT